MRGDVYRIKPGRDPRGHEQAGARYGVVVQDERLPLSTVLVVPTSTSCAPAVYRPVVHVAGQDTRAMVEQLSVCDPQRRFGERVGHLTHDELDAIDTALRLILSV